MKFSIGKIRGKLPFFKKEKTPKIKPQITDILPYYQIEGKYIRVRKYFIGYIDILQDQTTNILSKSESEVEKYIADQTSFLRTYLESFKEIDLNFPTNCTRQRAYWEKKLDKAKTDVQIQFIEQIGRASCREE